MAAVRRSLTFVLLATAALAALAPAAVSAEPTPSSQLLRQDVLRNADLWGRKPKMLAAGLGFTGIVGVPGMSTADLPGSEALVRGTGGAWNTVSCAPGTTPELFAYTSASTPEQVAGAFGEPVDRADGLPVEFSWPIRPSTLDADDFRVTLNTGEVVTPLVTSIFPNEEYDERAVAVLFGHFGNRIPPGTVGAAYPVRTEVVAGATPLQLIGPGGRPRSAVGLAATATTSPYGPAGSGPHLVAAKLTKLSTKGEGAPAPFASALPNDGRTLYGAHARYRLRVFTSGGFSPDGVRPVLPTDFARFFRLRLKDGRTLTNAGVDYRVSGHRLRVLGLADLGRRAATYDDCYREDKDNQIDIVLDGDRAAMKQVAAVEIPASGRHSAFYNPGGPGNAPTPGVRYTASGPAQRQPVLVALDDPMTTSLTPAG